MRTSRFAVALLLAVPLLAARPTEAQYANSFDVTGKVTVAHQDRYAPFSTYLAMDTVIPGEDPAVQEVTFECTPALSAGCLAAPAGSCVHVSGYVRPIADPVTGVGRNPLVITSGYYLPPGSCY